MGNYYAKARAQDIYAKLLCAKTPQTVYLIFEPGNKYDVNAIAVYDSTRMNMLGHLDRDSAARVTRMVHSALDELGMDTLTKTQYRLTATTKSVGSRVYVTLTGCERHTKEE